MFNFFGSGPTPTIIRPDSLGLGPTIIRPDSLGLGPDQARFSLLTQPPHLKIYHFNQSTSNPGKHSTNLHNDPSRESNNNSWIPDSRATDHMIIDAKTCTNANGVLSCRGDQHLKTITYLSLMHTFFVPSLFYKLLTIGQIITSHNCFILTYSTFCLLQEFIPRRSLDVVLRRGIMLCRRSQYGHGGSYASPT